LTIAARIDRITKFPADVMGTVWRWLFVLNLLRSITGTGFQGQRVKKQFTITGE
jgi:hypothetical protein